MKNFKNLVVVICLMNIMAVEAVGNDKPVAIIESNNQWVYACESFTLKSKSVDNDGWLIRQEWNIDQSGKKIFLGTQPEISLGLPYTRPVGDLFVTLEVMDNSNDPNTDKDTKTIKLYTEPNPAPRINRIDKSDFPNNRGSFYPGEKFNLNAIMYSDAIMRSLQIKWSYDKSIFGFTSDVVANPEVTVLSAPNVYEHYSLITVETTNACGEKGTLDIKIPVKKIPVNSPPMIKIVGPDSVNENTEFWISSAGSTTGNGYNEPEDSLTYLWSCNRQGVKENLCVSGGSAILVRFPDGGQNIEFSLKICDKFNACASANTSVFIKETENDRPIANASATGRTAIRGSDFILDCSRSSDDRTYLNQGVQTCIWTLTTTIKGVVITEQVFSKNKTQKYKFNISGDWNVQLRVRDGGMLLSDNIDSFKVIVLKEGDASISPVVSTPVPMSAIPVAPASVYTITATPVSVTKLPPFVVPPQKVDAASAFLTIVIVFFAYWVYRRKK